MCLKVMVFQSVCFTNGYKLLSVIILKKVIGVINSMKHSQNVFLNNMN